MRWCSSFRGGDEEARELQSFYSPQTSGTIYRWRVLAATFLTYFIDSYDLIVLAIAMPVLLKVLNISLPEGGLLGSATMIGAVLGSVVFGLIAENRGRRLALVLAITCIIYLLGTIILLCLPETFRRETSSS